MKMYVAAVIVSKQYLCTGTVITQEWVITSALPVKRFQNRTEEISVRLNSIDRGHGGSLMAAKYVNVHPKYVDGYLEFDIALIRLAVPAKFIAALPNFLQAAKKKCSPKSYKVLSWLPDSQFNTNNSDNEGSLKITNYSVRKRDSCRAFMAKFNIPLTNLIICLEPNLAAGDNCARDAGAALFKIGNRQVDLRGVISGWTSANCTLNPSPVIATRFSASEVRGWVQRTLNEYHENAYLNSAVGLNVIPLNSKV